MSNSSSESHKINDDEILPEYDFSKGIRGKHYQSYRQGHSLSIHQEDGTEVVHYFTLAEGAIMLDPDVKQCFPDSESVNQTLRSLISQKANNAVRSPSA
jgi:hypothetical protein